jgi:7,8-dihydropterin-6-yl-methyl-4-(beta-D-ribofuranosyl)aminobenzene 5'-phosphate synthase
LVDNHAQKVFRAEWGFSLYIEGSKNILFDFGDSDLYLENADQLGINVVNADYFVLSHGHWDHGNGLRYLPKRKLILHPGAFVKRYNEERFIGLPLSYEEAHARFDLIASTGPYKIDENITFLGEIPRETDFEAKSGPHVKEDGSWDPILDDSALAIKTKKGLVVISGCAHSGICNTIEYAIKVSGMDKVYAVLGGFHLKGEDEVTQKTVNYLKGKNIEKIAATHCTEFPALVEFANVFGSRPLASGQVIEL